MTWLVTQADQVVYVTRSNHESENGAVVRRVVEQYKESLESNCKQPHFHLKRCTQSKEEEQCYYNALLEKKVHMHTFKFVGGGKINIVTKELHLLPSCSTPTINEHPNYYCLRIISNPDWKVRPLSQWGDKECNRQGDPGRKWHFHLSLLQAKEEEQQEQESVLALRRHPNDHIGAEEGGQEERTDQPSEGIPVKLSSPALA